MRLTARKIMALTAAEHGLTVQALIGPERARRPTAARYDAMARVRDGTKLSLPAIGKLFGRHHTSVLYGIREHRRRGSDFSASTNARAERAP